MKCSKRQSCRQYTRSFASSSSKGREEERKKEDSKSKSNTISNHRLSLFWILLPHHQKRLLKAFSFVSPRTKLLSSSSSITARPILLRGCSTQSARARCFSFFLLLRFRDHMMGKRARVWCRLVFFFRERRQKRPDDNDLLEIGHETFSLYHFARWKKKETPP